MRGKPPTAENPWRVFKHEVERALSAAMRAASFDSPRPLLETLEVPPDPKLGDLATTVCFELARTLHKTPSWIANEITQHLKPSPLISKVETANNYINFFVNLSELTRITFDAIEKLDERYGAQSPKNKKVIVEHTSVNPTKPLHIGHGRNAVLGDTIARVLRFLGFQVEVHNYIDDMGRQMAETLLAYTRIRKRPRAKFDHVLGLLYAEFHKRVSESEKLESEVRSVLKELEKGRGTLARRARQLAERCVKANLETTDRLGISYDVLVWESDLARSGIVEEALNALRESSKLVPGTGERAGTLVLKLSDFGMSDKVLVRSDGTAVYTARDIAYQLWKFGKTKQKLKFKLHSRRPDGTRTYTSTSTGKSDSFGGADIVVNVVGAEQRFPQQVVFAALRLLGYEQEFQNSHHLAYEHVWLPTGRFSGRKGTWVGHSVDDVVEDAVARAYQIVKEHAPKASPAFWKQAAESVGIAAVRYSLLATSPEKRIVFRWEEALDFQRNSGPAIQYAHARACSILRKAGKVRKRAPAEVLQSVEEATLIKLLARFPEVVADAGLNFQPHLLAQHAAAVALAFNTFYEACPVLTAETPDVRSARLRLVNCTRVVLRNALSLMGIPAPERM